MATPVEQVPRMRLKQECDYLEQDTNGFSRADLVTHLKSIGVYKIDLRWPARPKPIDIKERSKDPSNIFIGNGAGLKEEGNNKLYIANSSTETPLIKGDFLKDKVTLHDCLNISQSDVTSRMTGEEGDIRRIQSTLYMYRRTGVHAGWYPIQFGPVLTI